MRSIPLSVLAGLAILASAAPARAAQRTYAADGSLATDTQDYDATTKIVLPTTGGPYPLLVASHGWSASGDNQLGWATHFASYGFVVAVPSFPSSYSPDTDVNAGIIEDLVTQLTGAKAATYKVKAGAYGLEGHSAGGLATSVAAAKLAPAAVVLFDPVDKDARGKAAYATLCAPTLAIFAESSSCNNNADWSTFAGATTADLVHFKVKNSTHCDGENNARALCGPFCGGAADPTRQKIYSHYATAFFLAKLAGDAAAQSALAQATLQGDTDLDGAAVAAGTCTPKSTSPTPAPTSTTPSGSATAAPPATSPSTPAATEPTTDDAKPGETSGCGCATAGAPRSVYGALAGLGLAVLALGRRRRHARG